MPKEKLKFTSEIKQRTQLPTYDECEEQVSQGTADALEVFIWRYEPGRTLPGSGVFGEKEFRIGLAKLLADSHPPYKNFIVAEDGRYSNKT